MEGRGEKKRDRELHIALCECLWDAAHERYKNSYKKEVFYCQINNNNNALSFL